MALHKILVRSPVLIVSAIVLAAWSPTIVAQAPSKTFAEPISFHGGKLTGFGWRESIRQGTMELRPTTPGAIFVSLRLEILEPFQYTKGVFNEITLTDEQGGIYRYYGWRTDHGWVELDDLIDPKTGFYLMGTDRKLPGALTLHFEVPASAHLLVLHYGTASVPFTW